jgi:hypothetical protein
MRASEAGGVRLAYHGVLIPAAGNFLDDVIVYEAGPHRATRTAFENLHTKRGTGLVNIDDVSLSVH